MRDVKRTFDPDVLLLFTVLETQCYRSETKQKKKKKTLPTRFLSVSSRPPGEQVAAESSVSPETSAGRRARRTT